MQLCFKHILRCFAYMIRQNIQLITYLFISYDATNQDLVYCGFLYDAVRMIK
jgi:hypothetical protein